MRPPETPRRTPGFPQGESFQITFFFLYYDEKKSPFIFCEKSCRTFALPSSETIPDVLYSKVNTTAVAKFSVRHPFCIYVNILLPSENTSMW